MEKFQELYEILQKEVKPALGCTGPIGGCYLAAEAYDAAGGGEIKKILVEGAVGPKSDDVAFPGTEYLGIEMAYALGAVCGDASAGLRVLHSVTPEGELKARKVAELVEMRPDWDRTELNAPKKITIETDKGIGVAVTHGAPDGLVFKSHNGEVLLERERDPNNIAGKTPIMKYKVKDFYEFATTYPLEKLDIMREAAAMNSKMAEHMFTHDVGVNIGNIGKTLLAAGEDSPVTRAKAKAAAACEGRMSGVNLPIMSVGGKGNVGVASSMPIVSLAEDRGASEEEMLRALTLSTLVAIAVIQRIGKAPTMCSCEVAAAMGVAAGATLLMGGDEAKVEVAMQNFIPNVFGVVCDGAKLACALRMATATGAALDAATLAVKGIRLANNQGVLDVNIDASIDFLGDFALNCMLESDMALNRKMMEKRKIFPLMTFSDRQKQ